MSSPWSFPPSSSLPIFGGKTDENDENDAAVRTPSCAFPLPCFDGGSPILPGRSSGESAEGGRSIGGGRQCGGAGETAKARGAAGNNNKRSGRRYVRFDGKVVGGGPPSKAGRGAASGYSPSRGGSRDDESVTTGDGDGDGDMGGREVGVGGEGGGLSLCDDDNDDGVDEVGDGDRAGGLSLGGDVDDDDDDDDDDDNDDNDDDDDDEDDGDDEDDDNDDDDG